MFPCRLSPIEKAGEKASSSGILSTLTGSPSGQQQQQLLFVGVNSALQRLVKLRSDIKIGEVSSGWKGPGITVMNMRRIICFLVAWVPLFCLCPPSDMTYSDKHNER